MARVSVLAVCLFCLGASIAFAPVRFAQSQALCARDPRSLQVLHLSASLCAGWLISFHLLMLASFVAAALIMAWRKRADGVSLITALHLVGLGAVFSMFTVLAVIPAGWQTTAALVRAVGTFIPLSYLYLFPDGRWVPRWAWLLSLMAAVYTLTWTLFPDVPFHPFELRAFPLGLLVGAGWIGLGVLAQVYRYAYVSNAHQRQQTKWVVLSAVLLVIGLLASYWPGTLWPRLTEPGLPGLVYLMVREPAFDLALMFVVVATFVSILRYRLWDIDVLIRRTLIYSLLSALLALLYFASVVGLQALLQGAGLGSGARPAAWVTVISTLGLAALAAPLRQRVQIFIDRRFYRRKYDITRTLAEFGVAVRDAADADLGHLTDQLLAVVDDTMEPAHLSLWLRTPPQRDGQRLE